MGKSARWPSRRNKQFPDFPYREIECQVGKAMPLTYYNQPVPPGNYVTDESLRELVSKMEWKREPAPKDIDEVVRYGLAIQDYHQHKGESDD